MWGRCFHMDVKSLHNFPIWDRKRVGQNRCFLTIAHVLGMPRINYLSYLEIDGWVQNDWMKYDQGLSH